MKVGDLVKFKNLNSSWGSIGLITCIKETNGSIGHGMITMITKASMQCTIPWVRRNTYIEEVINE